MADDAPQIRVQANGPYVVSGSVRLRRKQAVVSEHNEPLTWRTTDELEAGDVYALCRCGQSSDKPFCDGTHNRSPYDGTEAAPTDTYAERAKRYDRAEGMVMVDDRAICEHAGFCGNRVTNAWKMVKDTADTVVRAQVMAMIERCPSGALTYEVAGVPVEPDLGPGIAAVADGPLWVTGGIPVERADGAAFESRARVTLCRCGGSAIKPLCDGTHKENGFRG